MNRYSAFISYSHADESVARWLHRAIETYRFPRALVGSPSPFGPVPRRLPPVFRDRDELPASGDLGHELRDALAASRFQIVLCSPKAAASKWTNEEILSFKRVHGEGRTLALIVSGEPYAGGAEECFPPALRFRLAADGALSDVPAEPIAADIRPGKDGRRLALLKLLAGLSGIRLDALARRDAARRQRRLMIVTAASLAIAVMTIGLAIYAESQRRVAVRQRLLAERSLDFLVGTFEVANPATENPRTITALTILNRASSRAAQELKAEPEVSARLLRTTGEIYSGLGLATESERDLHAAIALEPAVSGGRAQALLLLARLADHRGDAKAAAALLDQAARSYDRHAPEAQAIEAQISEQRGEVEFLKGNYVQMAAFLDQASGQYERLAGDQREKLGHLWMNEGRAFMRIGRLENAEILFAKAVAAYSAKFGNDHVLTATAIQNQALVAFARGHYADAAQKIGRAVAIYDRVLDADHPTVAAAMILMGRIRTARGDGAGALIAFDRARTIFSKLYGPTNAAVGDVDFYAAEAEAKRGDIAAALRRLANTKRIYDASYGPNDPDQAELLLARARILSAAARLPEAQANCAAALALQKKIAQPASVISQTAATCAGLARR